MCRYSVEADRSRFAVTGDRLVSKKIGSYGSMAFVSPGEPDVAVCLLPGTQVIFSNLPQNLQDNLAVKKVAAATFHYGGDVQTLSSGLDYFDFDGRRKLLDHLPTDLELTVEVVLGDVESLDEVVPAEPVAPPPTPSAVERPRAGAMVTASLVALCLIGIGLVMNAINLI